MMTDDLTHSPDSYSALRDLIDQTVTVSATNARKASELHVQAVYLGAQVVSVEAPGILAGLRGRSATRITIKRPLGWRAPTTREMQRYSPVLLG